MNGNIKYSIDKFLGSYSIVIENGLKTTKHYDVSEDIVKIIEQLEGENKHLLDLQTQADKDYEELQVRVDNAIERLEALIVFWKKYNPIDKAMQIGQFDGVIEILKGGKK